MFIFSLFTSTWIAHHGTGPLFSIIPHRWNANKKGTHNSFLKVSHVYLLMRIRKSSVWHHLTFTQQVNAGHWPLCQAPWLLMLFRILKLSSFMRGLVGGCHCSGWGRVSSLDLSRLVWLIYWWCRLRLIIAEVLSILSFWVLLQSTVPPWPQRLKFISTSVQ